MSNRELIARLRELATTAENFCLDLADGTEAVSAKAMREAANALEAHEWQPIEMATKGELVLFFPQIIDARGQISHHPMIKIDHFPVAYPRRPTLWQPKPTPPDKAS